MSFALTLVAMVGAGVSLLRLLRLDSGRLAIDVPLGWYAGCAWFSLAVSVLRFGAGVSFSAPLALALVLLPVAAAVALTRGKGAKAIVAPRWLPKPLWLFAPILLWIAVAALGVLLAGFGTPTDTDDGVRVRAFTPVLAFDDAWSDRARALLGLAGALPTFVPAFAWRLTGTVELFHVNHTVLAHFVALLALAVAVPATQRAPERGWAQAFALTSLPLFLFHLTTTYQDAPLAAGLGAAFVFVLAYAESRRREELGRALVVLAAAALIKREGRVVAAALAVPLVAWALWTRRKELGPARLAIAAGACAAAALAVALSQGDTGFAHALSAGTVAAPASGPNAPSAARVFVYALLDSGNAGVLYWVFPLALAGCARTAFDRTLRGPLFLALLLFALVAVSSVVLFPLFTVDQSTVHRALIAPSVLLALWTAALLTRYGPAP